MVRRLRKLVISEVSSVDRGAGRGVKIVLMKNTPDWGTQDRTPPLNTRGRISENDSSGVSVLPDRLEQYAIALMRANPWSRAEAYHYLLHTAHGHALARHLSKVT